MSLPQPAPLQILHFHADWSPPSRTVQEFLKIHATTTIHTYKTINVDTDQEAADTHAIEEIPTCIILNEEKEEMKRINGDLTRDISAGIAWCERQQRNTEDEKYNTMVDTEGMKNKLNSTHKTAVKSTDITETQIMEIDASGTMEERCQRILKQHPLLVFIKGTSNAPQCGFSKTIIRLIRDKKVSFGYFNILTNEDIRQGLKQVSDWPTYPQLYVNGEFVGGVDIIEEIIVGGLWDDEVGSKL